MQHPGKFRFGRSRGILPACDVPGWSSQLSCSGGVRGTGWLFARRYSIAAFIATSAGGRPLKWIEDRFLEWFKTPIHRELRWSMSPTIKFAPGLLVIAVMALGVPAAAQNQERQQAIALEQQGHNAAAEAAWHKYAAQHPSDAEPLAHIGLLEARQEHYDAAIAAYRRAMALAPAMPGLRLNLGLAYFKNGDYRQALSMLAPLMKTQPDERLSVLMGMSHYGLGQYADAAPYLRRAAADDPGNLTLLLTLAHSCLLSHQYPCVLDIFHKIVALNAESAEADMLAGEALDEMHETASAIQEFRAAVAADPKEPNVHFGLGYLLWTQAQYPEAAQQFEAELQNVPGHLQAMRYLADSYIEMNKYSQAESLLKKAIPMDPANEMAHRDLGILYMQTGRNQDALRELQQAERLAPKDVAVHWRLGRLYRVLGKNAEAKAEAAQAVNLDKKADEGLLKAMSKAPASKVSEPAAKK